jgi:ferredoxin
MGSIYWFSGTGNSYHAARTIGDGIGDTRLVRITDRLRDRAPGIRDGVVGFAFPVYAGGMPVLVSELMEGLSELSADYLFAVATHAGLYGNALRQFRRLAEAAGQAPDALFDVVMPANTKLSEEQQPPGSKSEAKLRGSEDALEGIAASVRDRSTVLEGRSGGLYGLAARLFHPIFARMIRRSDSSFGVTDDCTSCGVCVRVCPADDITLDSDGRPSWKGRCEGCGACVSWCPEHAIYKGSKSERRFGYRHPEVSAGYLMRSD